MAEGEGAHAEEEGGVAGLELRGVQPDSEHEEVSAKGGGGQCAVEC